MLVRALKGGKNTKIVTLSGKKITKMPSSLDKLPGLKTLNLQNNRISKVCSEISTLTQLTVLNLGNNLLEEIPEEMKYLTSLKKLHLFGNKICKFASGACDGLQNLILLNLNNNELAWIPQEISRRKIDLVVNLGKALSIHGSASSFYSAIKLKNLKYLSINHNQLASIPKELCFLKNLFELHLNYNQLICIPEEIKFLKELQKLLLVRNNIEVLPKGICRLKNLRILDIAGNIIQTFPSGFQNLKLREFYCEGNPLFLKEPVTAVQQDDVWSLQEITSRFIMNELSEKNPFVMQAITWHPLVKNIMSQRRKCAICGKYFLTIWLECVEFVPPSKTFKKTLYVNSNPDEFLKINQGLVIGSLLCILIEGLAFAILSSVHPVFGLYGSLFPAIIYAIFGMGRHVATGTFALTSLISANAVERLVPLSSQNLTTQSNTSIVGLSDFEMQRIGVAAAVSFLGGVIQVAMFVLQLGSATFLLTEPVISAMTTGAATHVVTSQVKYLLGMKMPYISGPLGFFYIYAYVFENIKSVRLEALLLSLLSIVVLVLVKELNEQFKRKIKVVLPVDLVLIIAASFACYCTNMEITYGLEVVGHIPKGIPPPRAPPMNVLSAVITEAFGVALVGYVASLALAQGSAKKYKYSVDDNQEFLAHGLSNVIPSFFFCIPSAAAMGRTAGLYSTGAKTQVACLISCVLVLIVIYAIGPLLYWLPMCVLASIIVVGLKGMLIQFRDLKKYWNVDKIDWGIWVSTYVFTICFAANVGLLFGVVCTIAIVIGRFPRAKTLSIKNMKEMEFKVKTETDGETLQQVKIISINNPLVFLNAKKFHADLMNIIQKENANNQLLDDISKCEQNTLLNSLSNGNCNEEASQPCPSEKCFLILDCSGVTFFDYSGVSMLVEVYMDCKNRSVEISLAHCTASLIKAMKYCGNPDSENPVSFESVSAALSNICSNKNLSKLSDHSEV